MNFAWKVRLPRNFRDLLHAVSLRRGTNGFTSLPKEGVLRVFSPWKIRRLRPGLNSRTCAPKASTLPLDHRSRSKGGTLIYTALDIRKVYSYNDDSGCWSTSTGTSSFTLRMEAVVIFFRKFGTEIVLPTRKNGQLWRQLISFWVPGKEGIIHQLSSC